MTEDHSSLATTGAQPGGPVSFAERMATSQNFLGLFREGMGLLEETADYLDGPGRAESRALSRSGGLAYATESMKLTTRLMQMASWLLLQRAVNEGELTFEQAAEEKNKVRLDHAEDHERTSGFDELPEGLKVLLERSLRLQARVRHLDRQLQGRHRAEESDSPALSQIDRLRSAFGQMEG